MIAEIIIDINNAKFEKTYSYTVPEQFEQIIEIGTIVTIPFGNRKVPIQGVVVELHEKYEQVHFVMKAIIDLLPSTMNMMSRQYKLAHWIKTHYHCTLQSALNLMFVSRKPIQEQVETWVSWQGNDILEQQFLSNNRLKNKLEYEQLIGLIRDKKEITKKDLLTTLNTTSHRLDALKAKGLISYSDHRIHRNIYDISQIKSTQKIQMNPEQQAVLNRLMESSQREESPYFLLHGITGSGKTEVFLQLIEYYLKKEQTVIVLIPEIALTPQTIQRFVGRFGEIIGVLHSRLSEGEKYEQWEKIKANHIKIVIGPRSALFAPLQQLGLIIIDESHEHIYRSEQNPRYNALDVAKEIGRLSHAMVLSATATPLVTEYYEAKRLDRVLTLKNKAVKQAGLAVELVDMRLELEAGNRSMLSKRLEQLIWDRLQKKEQIIIFLNRRGYAKAVSCRSCGLVYTCPECLVPTVYHKENVRLICHHCGFSEKKPDVCKKCGSKFIKEFGIGTQKVAEILQASFPNSRILRMDADTTATKNSHERILAAFDKGEADILVGTQMIAKGHDFKKLTLVGVIAADTSLHLDDYRVNELTYQLLTQVNGRAGRHQDGISIVQTYSPENYSIQAAQVENYQNFYEQEIAFRQLGFYPPFAKLLLVMLKCSDEIVLNKGVEVVKAILNSHKMDNAHDLLQWSGPAKPYVYKLQKIYQLNFTIKSKSVEQLSLIIEQVISQASQLKLLTINYDMIQ